MKILLPEKCFSDQEKEWLVQQRIGFHEMPYDMLAHMHDVDMTAVLVKEEYMAGKLKNVGIWCVGIGEMDIPSTDLKYEHLTDFDQRYTEMMCSHYYQHPYVIYTDDEILIRESIPEDYENLQDMFNVSGMNMFPEKNIRYGSGSSMNLEKDIPYDKRIRMQREKDMSCDNGIGMHPEKNMLCDMIQEQKEKFQEYIRTAYRFYGCGFWSVLVRKPYSDKYLLAGWCGLYPSEYADMNLGYLVAPGFRRQGVAYRSCAAALHFAEEVLGFEKIAVEIERENEPSVALAEKLGFVRVCEAKESMYIYLIKEFGKIA